MQTAHLDPAPGRILASALGRAAGPAHRGTAGAFGRPPAGDDRHGQRAHG